MNLLSTYLHWAQSPCNPTMDNLIAAMRTHAYDQAWIEGCPSKQQHGMSLSANHNLLAFLEAFNASDYYRYTRLQGAFNSTSRLTARPVMVDEG